MSGLCGPGFFDSSGTCTECPQNYYKDSTVNDAGQVIAACTMCTNGRLTMGNGSTSEDECSKYLPIGEV